MNHPLKNNCCYLLFFLFWSVCNYIIAQNQTQRDSYTRYELLSPESNSFRIIYDVSATTAGANFYYNTLRKGSEHQIDAVYDRMTGLPLKWMIVDGAHAKNNGHPTASEEYEYLKVILARAVPEGGAARIRIDKTYKDPNSYYSKDGQIVFDRSLGIKRNAVVLPKGYELVACNYPSQVELETSGSIKTSFMNRGAAAVPYKIVAKKLPANASIKAQKPATSPWSNYEKKPSGRDKSHARLENDFKERAFQNRDIVYFLQQPETHDFRLYHDYTEFREGVDKYINIVRKGSKASNPSAKILDTGETLTVETLKGEEIKVKGIDIGSDITPETEIVVIWFDAVKKGESVRLRIEETYTDPNRYVLYGNELVWDRSFGRNRNTVILPEGWYVTHSAIPAIIDQTETGQSRLYFMNDRPDAIDVYVKGLRRNEITQSAMSTTINQHDYELGVVGGFSELVAAGVKQVALSAPMTTKEMDAFMLDAKQVAAKYGVSVFRESDLIVTDLFPAEVAKDKEVLLLYTGTTKDAYLQLKEDQKKLKQAGKYDQEASRAISRRFGRLLSYSPKKINQLLAQNTDFRTLADFGIKATTLFLYYKDLTAAGAFYTKTLGMELVADYEMALILRMTADSYLILVDATKGMHTADEPKTVALALLTDQLKEWYEYLKSENVTIKYHYKEGPAHDGFVAIDPEGYLLEFERFNQHPENEKFIPILKNNIQQSSSKNTASNKPVGLSIHSTITWLYHKDVLAMENYYKEVLGLELVADQGWTKIFQVSNTSFLATVDGKRGMHQVTDKQAVNVGFIIEDLVPWFEYVKANPIMELRDKQLHIGPDMRYKSFVGYGPEGYYLEFDAFYPHSDNVLLMEYLRK